MPASYHKRFFELLLKGVTYEERKGVFYVNCGLKMRNVQIMVQGHWMRFNGEDMVINANLDDIEEQVCILNWLPNVDDFWVFGIGLF